MTKRIFTALALFAGLHAAAGSAEITLVTQAPAGTSLRIYSMPYGDMTVTGADKGEYFGQYVSKGPGTTIRLGGRIDQLEVYGCQLSALDIAAAPDMYILKCYSNAISSLNVSNAPVLAILEANDNRLDHIDLSNCTALEEVNLSGNVLNTLVSGELPNLTKLNCSGNELPVLDLEGCPALEELYAANNHISSLDLHANTKLWWMHLFGNEFVGPTMDEFIATLPEAAMAPALLYMVNTRGQETNLCLSADVKRIREKGWAVMDWKDGIESNGLIGSIYYGADYVPAVSDLSVVLTTARIPGETITLNVKSTGTFAIEGVAESTTAGKAEYTLRSSTVVIKGDITLLECPGNELIGLAFNGTNPYLTALECNDNAIQSLDLVNATALTRLNAQNNALRHLNIEGCTAILRVDCYGNKLYGSAMRQFMQSLPDGKASNPYLFVIDTKDTAEGNVATTDDVAIAKEKGWSVFDFAGGDRWGMGLAYDGSDPSLVTVPEEYFTFVSDNSRTIVTLEGPGLSAGDFPIVEGGEVMQWNGNTLGIRATAGQTVTVYGNYTNVMMPFSVLTAFDPSHLPNLTDLNICLNEITSLDLSQNTALNIVSVEGNLLTALDLSSCANLIYANVYGNAIEGEAMTAMMQSLPERDLTHFGTLIVYDGTYGNEFNKCLESDVTIAGDRCWLVYELDENGDPQIYKGMSAIANISADAAEAPVYYNMQGLRVAAPAAGGIYLRRQGPKVEKVAF